MLLAFFAQLEMLAARTSIAQLQSDKATLSPTAPFTPSRAHLDARAPPQLPYQDQVKTPPLPCSSHPPRPNPQATLIEQLGAEEGCWDQLAKVEVRWSRCDEQVQRSAELLRGGQYGRYCYFF